LSVGFRGGGQPKKNAHGITMTTSLFFFIFVTALVNLGVGYALAVYLGHGSRFDLNVLALPGLWWSGGRACATAETTMPAPSEVGTDTPPEPPPKPVDGAAPVSPLADVPEPSQFQDNVSRLREEVHRHGRELTRIEELARELQTAPTREALSQCRQDLADADRRYLKRQREDLHALTESTPDSDAHRTTSNKVQQAGESHVTDLQESLDGVDGVRVRDDNLEAVCQQLLDETARQLESTQQFFGELDTAIISIIEAEYDVVDSPHAPSAATEN
jgi:hypothetical protein